jgi:hypothetical protein
MNPTEPAAGRAASHPSLFLRAILNYLLLRITVAISSANNINNFNMPHSTLAATLRITSDICGTRNIVHPSSALRLIDHNLQASGIIPAQEDFLKETIDRPYAHDWYCVGQAVTCFPMKHIFHRSFQMHQDVHSHTWVQPTIGKSSIRFASVITMGTTPLVTACRVFARRDVVSGGPAPFTEEERERFLQHYSVDETTAAKLWTLASHPLALVERLPKVSYAPTNDETPVLRVRVGPTNVNFGNHADHAFLAETAAHALSIGDTDNDNDGDGPLKLELEYVSEARLGDTLDCFVEGTKAFVFSVQENGQRVLVLQAEQTRM